MKRPVEILYKRLIRPVSHGHASVAQKGVLFTTLSERYAAGVPNNSRCINSFGILFTRNYASAASSSEQVNLIKQLRERTSAPMKEVKSALVACDWDIGEPQMSFSLLFSIDALFMVGYSRGCTE